jgi:hypothetical protein
VSRVRSHLQQLLLGLALGAMAAITMGADTPRPDLSGVWLPVSKDSGRWPAQLPLTPAAAAARQRWNDAHLPIEVPRDDEYLSCTPYKLPQIISTITQYPFEVVQTPQQLLIHTEVFGQIRRIHMDGALAGDRLPTHTGYSRGQWEGAQLVVETTHILPQHEGSRFPASPAMRIVERFSLQGSGQSRLLIDEVTVSDPAVYKEPFSFRMVYKTVAGVEVGEYICEQDIWDQHRDGNASRIPWR